MTAPTLFGMRCAEQVCVEAGEDLPRAIALVAAARATVAAQTGQRLAERNVILCNSAACYRRFGGGAERTISYPWLGMIVAGPVWRDYIIRHELVHWVQFSTFGALATMRMPVWKREGMAYALSKAPEDDIPEQYLPLIMTYRKWQGARPDDAIWAHDN